MFAVLTGINTDLNLWAPRILVSVGLIILFVLLVRAAGRWRAGQGMTDIFELIEAAGYSYDPEQDIFYSKLDSWQRNMGYCRLYDEALAPSGMVIDCEPVYFEYAGKRWLIEFWKGQYALNTGCEIGVYTTEGPDLNIPDVFKGTFYRCASPEDQLEMACSLEKNGKILFARKDCHWWLTGFKLGEFTEPAELTMTVKITLKDEKMCAVFVSGLQNAGYSRDEIFINGKTVDLVFDQPRTPQPLTRTAQTDALLQMKNRLLCDKYQEITGPYDNFPDKLRAVQEQFPELFQSIIKIGKPEKVFEMDEEIK